MVYTGSDTGVLTMGSRDYRHREEKKNKKKSKKLSVIELIPTANVEVIRKGKKARQGEEEKEAAR
jgi:hypothetical protein